jgi:Tfp pilus assembly protein PilF
LNVRLLFGTALLLALAGSAALGVKWYHGQPAYLLASARRYFDQGEEALHRPDPAAARAAYQFADAQLRRLSGRDQAPAPATALQLRHQVLNRLAALQADEEKNQPAGEGEPLSARLAAEARRLAFQAAEADATLFEAQAAALNYCFRDDLLTQAIPFAENVLRYRPADADSFPQLNDYLHGARFVLARAALRTRPPRPDAALEHLAESAALLPPGREPRWRAFGLEAQARAVKIENIREAARPLPGTRPPGPEADSAAEAVSALRARIAEGLERVRREKGRVTPATATEPERAELAKTSPTDVRGLFDFLALAVRESTSAAEALERAGLLVEVCEVVAAKSPPPIALRTAALTAAGLPRLLGELPEGRRPLPADRAALYARVEAVSARALAAGLAVDPATFLRMADLARATGNAGEALRLAEKGLQVASSLQLPDTDPAVLDLHTLAAWMLLALRQPEKTAEHLAPLLADKEHAPAAHLLRGLAAVSDGRLERGAADLRQAALNPRIDQTVYPHLGLARAYLGMGRYGPALEELGRVGAFFARYDRFGPEERAVALQMLPDAGALRLDRLRCLLGLGQVDRARREWEAMSDGPEGPAAGLILVGGLSRLAEQSRRAGNADEARELSDRTPELIATCRRLYPDSAAFVAADARQLLAAPGAEQAAARREAEKRIKAFTSVRKEPAAALLWARWLAYSGKFDEARAALKRMEEADFPEQRRAVQMERARLELAAGRSEEVTRLAGELGHEGPDLGIDMLLAAGELRGGNAKGAEERLDAALTRYGGNGPLHLWLGRLAQARGDFAQAARSYERALEYTAVRGAARTGLLACVLGLAERETPASAAELADRLHAAHPEDAAVLLARAHVARMLDKLAGRDGVDMSLEAMKSALSREGAGAAGAYLAAHCWLACGRPDVARRELEAALKSDPRHVPSLLAAARLVRDSDGWDSCLRYADALEVACPGSADALRLRGESLAALRRPDEARDAFRTLAEKGPDRPAGFRGLVVLHERTGDLTEALRQVTAWRRLAPADAEAVRAEVRLRTRLGDPARAEATADEAVSAAGRTPSAEVDMALAAEGGFADAGALDRAQSRAERAVALAEKLPAATRGRALATARAVLAEVLTQRARAETVPARRKEWVDRAVAQYQAARAALPDHFAAGNNLAYLLLRERGDAVAALAIVEGLRKGKYSGTPISGDRFPLEFLDTAGEVYRTAGRPEQAVALFKEAVRRYADEPRAFVHLGLSYAAAGKPAEAREALARAARLGDAKAAGSVDTGRKARFEALAADARGELEKIGK